MLAATASNIVAAAHSASASDSASASASTSDPAFETTFTKMLYPGLKNGLRSKNELVRAEILSVLAYAITVLTHDATLQEMRGLLAGGDDEASFFTNVHHIQVHRRTRALRRLAEYCAGGRVRSVTIKEIFVPLVGNFVVAGGSSSSGGAGGGARGGGGGGGGGVDHQIVTEAIATMGKMAGQLKWGAYYALVQGYLRLARGKGRGVGMGMGMGMDKVEGKEKEEKEKGEKVFVRAVVAVLENFHFEMGDVEEVGKVVDGDGDDGVGEGEDDNDDDEIVLGRSTDQSDDVGTSTQRHLSKQKLPPTFEGLKTLPSGHKIQEIRELMTVPVIVTADLTKSPPVIKVYSVNPYAQEERRTA